VRNIFSDDGQDRIVLLLNRFCGKEPAFCKPLTSGDLGIYALSNISDSYDICSLADVACKYVLLPGKDSNDWIGIPLIHTL